MDKEKLITIAIGLLVGISIAGLYFAAVKFLPNLRFLPSKMVLNSTPSGTDKNSTSSGSTAALAVTQPQDETTTKDSPITVAGKSQPGAEIIIYSNADEKVASADAQGNFSADIKLEEGENAISITSLPTTGKPETVQRSIILEISL